LRRLSFKVLVVQEHRWDYLQSLNWTWVLRNRKQWEWWHRREAYIPYMSVIELDWCGMRDVEFEGSILQFLEFRRIGRSKCKAYKWHKTGRN
jgi:hypothetical protein